MFKTGNCIKIANRKKKEKKKRLTMIVLYRNVIWHSLVHSSCQKIQHAHCLLLQSAASISMNITVTKFAHVKYCEFITSRLYTKLALCSLTLSRTANDHRNEFCDTVTLQVGMLWLMWPLKPLTLTEFVWAVTNSCIEITVHHPCGVL